MVKVSILIPVHNGIEYTKKCINNLQEIIKKEDPTCEMSIVVIDDGSTDGTSEWIGKLHNPNIHLIQGNGSLWWSGGINLGAKYSFENLSADFLLLWNNDIQADKDYFDELKKLIQINDNATIIGSKIYDDIEMKSIWSFGGFFNTSNGKFYMEGYKKEDQIQFQKPLDVDWLPGMGTLVPKKVVDCIGYWDEINFPQYHGDSDFTIRAKLHGFKILVYPQLKIWNDVSNTGMKHDLNFKKLIHQLYDIKSNLNVKKNFLFYRKYSTNPFAYSQLLKAYFRLFGGYLKWKLLSYLGISKKKLV